MMSVVLMSGLILRDRKLERDGRTLARTTWKTNLILEALVASGASGQPTSPTGQRKREHPRGIGPGPAPAR